MTRAQAVSTAVNRCRTLYMQLEKVHRDLSDLVKAGDVFPNGSQADLMAAERLMADARSTLGQAGKALASAASKVRQEERP